MDPDGRIAIVAGVAVGIVAVGTVTGTVIGGLEAAGQGESILAGAVRGGLQGFGASLAGLAFAPTKDPRLIGGAASLTSNLIGQGFDRFTGKAQPFNVVGLAFDTFIGAALGPAIAKAIPLRGPTPNLLKTRTIEQLMKLKNARQLFRQTAAGEVHQFLIKLVVRSVANLPDAEAQELVTRDKK